MSVDPFEHIIALIEQGNLPEAQNVLKRILSSDKHNLTAWYWCAKTCTTSEQRIKVLELCLQHNPGNELVLQALHKLQAGSSNTFTMQENLTKNSIINTWGGRFSLIVGTIIIAMVVAAFVTFHPVILIPTYGYIFSAGLIYAIQGILGSITGQKVVPDKNTFDLGRIILGWLIYLVISIPAIVTKKRAFFFILYTILVVLLMVNIAGCQASMPDIQNSSW